MPRSRNNISRSVAQNEPLPGLSMIGSPCFGSEFRDDVPARFSSHEDFPAGAGIADAGPDSSAAPALIIGQIRQIRPVAFPGVEDMHPDGSGFRQAL